MDAYGKCKCGLNPGVWKGVVGDYHNSKFSRGILKGGPQLADRAETADHIHKDATDRYAPCLRALLLFARPIVNIGDFIIVLY